jgi:phosphoglycerate dehydrogenase-like enzyme
MPKVIFFTSLVSEIVKQFIQQAPADYEVQVHSNKLPDTEKITLAQEADFLLLFPGEISDEVLRAAPYLKLIQLVSAGFDRINIDLCQELGIPVANNGGTNAIDVAEHTLALILSFYRRLLEMDRNVRADNWKGIDSGVATYTIHGKIVGIIGLGHIGQQVAQRLLPFGARILFYDPYPPAPAVVQALGATQAALDDLLAQSDIVTLHVPLLDNTYHLIGPRELALMKPNALLVNTCRGPVIDEAALTNALRQRQIFGAALDVLEEEPPDPDNPLLQLENVLFTPHTAGVTFDTWARRAAFIFQNFERVWQGKPPLAVVNG